MQKQIILQDEIIEYSLRQSARARCLRVTIYPGGELAATLPRNFSLEQLENFLRQKADWILRKMNLARRRKPAIFLPKSSRREYLARRKKAFEIVKNKINQFGAMYNLYPNRISIRNQKTRWGSCSRKGNLNFNYRIVHLPEKYLDYVIVHELCHLKQFNHSRSFWDLVELAIPECKKIRKEIRSL